MRTFYQTLRIFSVITLFFFCWTFMPLWQIAAWAAEKQGQKSGVSRQGSGGKQETTPRPVTSGERFEKALEGIREHIHKAETRSSRGEEPREEIDAIRVKKAEIESIDAELKTEFAATEKKLKEAHLPSEILDRHTKFVKHYQDNLKELIGNLDQVEKAQTRAEVDRTVKKAKLHLEKTKPPRKHKPLDPNNLPHRMVKAKEKAPRLKKEEFEHDFPPQRSPRSPRTADLQQFYHSAFANKPILVASNGSLAGLLSSSPEFKTQNLPFSVSSVNSVANVSNPHFASTLQHFDASPFLLAQVTDQPTADDLAETPEIQFTDAIRAKAQELGKNPVKIYEWVRNNIGYQPYYGSFKGAAQTLLEGSGNDLDQASLLIALLRVSQIEARYAYGTVEIPIEKVMNWVGGVTDPRMAGTILATKGIPAKLIISGSTAKSIQLEHVWVEAWIDYFPSWGARHKTGQGDTWIPIDPSYKQYTYKQGMDIYAQMGFNAEEFLMSHITDTRNITAYQDFSKRFINFIDVNYPNATIEDVFGASEIKLTRTIVKQEFPYLLGTLPYKTIAKAAQFSQVPTAQNYVITIQIEGNSLDGTPGLNYSGHLNSLADKRITVSYASATAADDALVTNYGGNMFAVPPYMLNVRPILKIGGTTVASGATIGFGQDQNIVISIVGSDGDTDRIQNIITAGNYSAIILQAQDTSLSMLSNNIDKLLESSRNVDSMSLTRDDLLGQMLYTIGVSYFQKLSFENEVYAKALQLLSLRQPAEAMVTHRVKVNYVFGLPLAANEGGLNIDVDRNTSVVVSPTQDSERVKAFMILSGLSSSGWENLILEAFVDVPAVSTVKLLKLASEQGIPIYTITSINLNNILPQLQLTSDVKNDVQNAVNAGKEVIISKTNLTFNQWNGAGYIIRDPANGSAGYMISGNTAGGDSMTWQDVADFWRTFYLRDKAVKIASALIGTTYVWGGASDTGTDCSGLVYQAYDGLGLPIHPAAGQYQTCSDKNWLRDWDQRLPGDIAWASGNGHDGILAGWNTIPWPPNSTTSTVTGLTVIHASGNLCADGKTICGKFKRVIESKIASPTTTDLSGEGLSFFGAPIDKVCRPR